MKIKENLVDKLITYQLNMIGKTVEEVKDDSEWYSNNTFNKEQAKEFKNYAIEAIKKDNKCGKKLAESRFMWFDLMYGLKVI